MDNFFILVKYFILEMSGKTYKGRVGSKGELFPPKVIREKLGLHPHTVVIYRIKEGKLIVEPVPKIEDVLKEPPVVKETIKEFHEFRHKLSREAET